jgi:GT2 family glycosyltransferase
LKTTLEATLILVNYRSAERSASRLAALAAGEAPPCEVVVVDNSPGEGLEALLAERRVSVAYVPMPRNVGFAAAVNEALRYARLEHLLLLNPDAAPEPGCLAGLLRALAGDASIAAAAPRLVAWSGDSVGAISALRRDPDLWTALLEYTALVRLAPRDWLERKYFLPPTGAAPVECAMVQGACMALSRSWIERVGVFDERFFLYWEETDWCRRARLQGGRILYCPALSCRHEGGASSESSALAARFFWKGLRAYHRKHGGLGRALAVDALVPAGIAAEYAILSALHLARRGRDARLAADRQRVRDRLGAL